MVTQDKRHKLKDVLRHIDEKQECVFCRSALIFAFIVLLLIVMLVFVYRDDTSSWNRPLSPDKAPKLTPADWNQHVLELGAIIHPELAASTSMSNKVNPPDLPRAPNISNPLIKNSPKINNK